jgi:hypothetical protein
LPRGFFHFQEHAYILVLYAFKIYRCTTGND